MLSPEKLELALDIHDRSYRLLKWVAEAIGKGFIPVARAHDYARVTDAAHDWVSANYHSLPHAVRPSHDQLVPFSNFFATYLMSSFDFIASPGQHRKSWDGCYCPWCSRMVEAPHLRPKTLTKRDKRRGDELMAQRLASLGTEHGMSIDADQITIVLKEPVLRRMCAYSTYGHWLIRRLDGQTDGAAILVLWREVAWKKTGSPITNFELRLKDFVEAEKSLISALQKNER